MIMGYVEVRRSAGERAALAVYGGMTMLYGGGQVDAVVELLAGLSPALRRQVVELADREVVDGLDELLRTEQDDLVADEQAADGPLSWDDRVQAALTVVLARSAPEFDVAEARDMEGFSALVRRVQERCLEEDVEPVVVLRRLGRRLCAVTRVDNPMVFLAAKVRDWTGSDPDA
jgi:hypothetical protein